MALYLGVNYKRHGQTEHLKDQYRQEPDRDERKTQQI